jgi:antitoxin CptB
LSASIRCIIKGNQGMTVDMSKLRWACRRGMLELDSMLAPFFEHHYVDLSTSLQQDFQRLLECSDMELFRCLLRAETPSDTSLALILGVIREKHQACYSG